MKKGKRMTTGKRVAFYAGLFILGLIVGAFGGFLSGFLNGFGVESGIFTKELLFQITRTFYILTFVVSLFYLMQASKNYKLYEKSEDDSDEVVDVYYRNMFRNLEFGTIFQNVSLALILFTVVAKAQPSISESGLDMSFTFMDLAAALILLLGQIYTLKLTQKIRNYKLSAFPTVSEMKDFAYSVDEGEKTAQFEGAFLTFFKLNQIVLPMLYLFVWFSSLAFETQEVTAYVVIAFIHIYINIRQIGTVRNYFK